MTEAKYSPIDIALFVIQENYSVAEQNQTLRRLYEGHSELFLQQFDNYLAFKRAVTEQLARLELNESECADADRIIDEITERDTVTVSDDIVVDAFTGYFKQIKLQIIFSSGGYKRVKMSTVLRKFGYKRRSQKLMLRLAEVLDALDLETYLKNREQCRICDIRPDEMITVRIRPGWHSRLIKEDNH